MTIERLLESTPEELEKLSDQQLNEFFAPYLKFVRPPETSKDLTTTSHIPQSNSTTHRKSTRKPNLDQQLEMLEELAKKKGLL